LTRSTASWISSQAAVPLAVELRGHLLIAVRLVLLRLYQVAEHGLVQLYEGDAGVYKPGDLVPQHLDVGLGGVLGPGVIRRRYLGVPRLPHD